MVGIIRKTIGTICMVIGALIFFIFVIVGYFTKIPDLMPFACFGIILMPFGYFLYPSEWARASLEGLFHFDEDGNLQ